MTTIEIHESGKIGISSGMSYVDCVRYQWADAIVRGVELNAADGFVSVEFHGDWTTSEEIAFQKTNKEYLEVFNYIQNSL